jgi:hypothetical protein
LLSASKKKMVVDQQQKGNVQQRLLATFPPTVAELYSRAMFDPTPTTTIISQKQLAYALGYPMDWRVERTVREIDGKNIIQDRIHALGGKKNKTKFMWLHHEAAQKAAALLEQEGTLVAGTNSNNTSSSAGATIGTGSHLLPPMPLYTKGDVIQVLYDGKWWEATITKRKKKDDEFYYSVYYHGDNATQDDIPEDEIRPGEDPGDLAVSLGFSNDWKASRKGSRYILTSPSGEQFTTKKEAMKVFRELQGKVQVDASEGVEDPPWRLEGHYLIGRQILWTFEHKASATRRIKIEQIGTITGYIDEHDKDKVRRQGECRERVPLLMTPNHFVYNYSLVTMVIILIIIGWKSRVCIRDDRETCQFVSCKL